MKNIFWSLGSRILDLGFRDPDRIFDIFLEILERKKDQIELDLIEVHNCNKSQQEEMIFIPDFGRDMNEKSSWDTGTRLGTSPHPQLLFRHPRPQLGGGEDGCPPPPTGAFAPLIEIELCNKTNGKIAMF